jgi:hypothetical protein
VLKLKALAVIRWQPVQWQLLQGRCDERLPDPHLGPIGQRAAFDQTDRGLIDTVAPLLRPR